MNLQEALHWRYATKRMNGQKIESAKADRIIESIRLYLIVGITTLSYFCDRRQSITHQDTRECM